MLVPLLVHGLLGRASTFFYPLLCHQTLKESAVPLIGGIIKAAATVFFKDVLVGSSKSWPLKNADLVVITPRGTGRGF